MPFCASMQCQAFDVIGSVGFGKTFNAAADLSSEGAESCRAVEQGEPLRMLVPEQHGLHSVQKLRSVTTECCQRVGFIASCVLGGLDIGLR